MDAWTTALITLTLIMVVTTFLAYRQGNEKRDLGLLGAVTGALGLGSLAAWLG